jgi:hypothetical protein
VIDWAGDQVAFVETIGSTAYLVLLRMTNSGSSVTTPSSVSASSYHGCTAPCYTTFSLSTTDSNSPPFYDYAHDTIYVGDDGGNVHQFTTAFGGTPTAGFTTKVTGSETNTHLTGPVVDPNSALIFVGDNSGYLHSINSSGGSLQTSNQTDTSSHGLVDAPLVDSTGSTSYVYVFVNNVTSQLAMYVNQFNASTSINATWGRYLQITGYSTSSPLYAGAFDNQHTTASNGNLYFCGSYSPNGANSIPTLYQITMNATFGNSTYITYNTPASGAATCSPVTEFYNGTTDYLYLSVTANGNATGICTGACLYNYSIPTSGSGTAGSILGGLSVAGGASSIIIDNNSTSPSDASNIYFYSLSTQSCNGSTTGCAVQASQAAP